MVAGHLMDSLEVGRPGACSVIASHMDSLVCGRPGAISVITSRLERNLWSIVV